jgi:hypothetical protein
MKFFYCLLFGLLLVPQCYSKSLCNAETIECFNELNEAKATPKALALGLKLLNRHLEKERTKPIVLTIQVAELLHEASRSSEAITFLEQLYRPSHDERDRVTDGIRANVLRRLSKIHLDQKNYQQAALLSREEIARRILAGYKDDDVDSIEARLSHAKAMLGHGDYCGTVLALRQVDILAKNNLNAPQSLKKAIKELEIQTMGKCR